MPVPPLGAPERSLLLELARAAIRQHLRAGEIPAPPTKPPELTAQRGVFVSLHTGGALRGCIGYIESTLPVGRAVTECAIKAATEDPRFPPLAEPELAGVDIDISLLTRPQPTTVESIIPGKHGVIIRHRGRTAVFLPQVATEQGWNREALLSQLCRKAGLPEGAWREQGAKLESFEAEVFGER